jgi:predicted P-loop ATPase
MLDLDQEVARLAELRPALYAKERGAAAKALGLKPPVLDAEVRAYRRSQIKVASVNPDLPAPNASAQYANGTHPQNDVWRSMLLTNPDGTPRDRCAENVFTALRHHPSLGPLLAFNNFSFQPEFIRAAPWDIRGLKYPRPLDDSDGVQAVAWLEKEGIHKITTTLIKEILVAVAKEKPYNPLVDWLQSLKWDNQPRIETWLSYYLGVKDSPYVRAIGPRFLISAVARGLKPGCKVDTMLILEGPQGQRKSSAARTLFGSDWFTDDLAEIGTKDAALQMLGRWGIEVPEMSSFSRAETKTIKAVLSRPIDRYRAPYERFVAEHPRQCVLIGTTNPIDGYFKDASGARRFWPVECGTIDLSALSHDREQLWAEAVHAFEHGAQWWLDKDSQKLATVEQDARHETDPWESAIHGVLALRKMITVDEILRDVIKLPLEKQDRKEQMRVAGFLSRVGWVKKRPLIEGARVWAWYAPEKSTTQDDAETSGNAAE